ncbi:MAG: biotin--[acetyl-CoA-carboxylase] ligase [Nitrospira sp. WS238]|nr:biotin--[acetyl-CoA-carboxylase] ligase [Nitrospira sp. WS238]
MGPFIPLNTDDIRSGLTTKSLGHSLYLHQEITSTNKKACALAQQGAAHGTVVLAECQSGGHGRHGRHWFSPPGCNIYCSTIVRAEAQKLPLTQRLPWTPLLSALAVAEAVRQMTTISLTLKWPNDLLLDERKVGGILCESVFQTSGDPTIIIGIGLNVNLAREDFPDELRPIAASLAEISVQPIDRNRLVAQVLLELEQCLDEFLSNGSSRLRQAYLTRCATLGRQVLIRFTSQEQILGIAEGIAADGALQVRPLSSPSRSQPMALLDVRAADVIHLRE